MIKIKAAYIGNSNEAFIENKFQDGINVIYSLDNDRGKTILMQSIMYTLGAIPTFPESFHYKDYIYILDLDVNGRKISILRDHNSFAVQEEGSIDLFDSVKSYTSFLARRTQPSPQSSKMTMPFLSDSNCILKCSSLDKMTSHLPR